MKEQKKHIRGSQSAFMQDGQVLSTYGTGCFRRQLIGSFGIETVFPAEIARVGALNEANYEQELVNLGVKYEREVPVIQPVWQDVSFSGRIDFICRGQEVQVRELKSATSENTFKNVIRSGKFKLENLAQITAYMIAMELDKGWLIYTYYPKEDAKQKDIAERSFLVSIEEDGQILVDMEDSKFTVANQLEHRYNSAKWLVSEEVPPQPKGHAENWKSPCKFCDFKMACNQYNMGLVRDREGFLLAAEKCVTKESKA